MEDALPLTIAEVLRQYAAGRRDFRELGIGPDPSGATFNHAVLDGVDFSQCFIETDFEDASLRDAKFVHANVKTCSFNRADLTRCSFAEAAIDAASFDGSVLDGANFDGAHAYGYTYRAGERP